MIILIATMFLSGCIGSKSMQEKVNDPFERRKAEEQLKGGKDVEYWNEVKDYYDTKPIIILDDTKH